MPLAKRISVLKRSISTAIQSFLRSLFHRLSQGPGIRFWITVIPLFAFSWLVGITFQETFENFVDLKSDTILFTNVIGALLLGFASILFGWVRAEDDGPMKREVKLTAVLSLYTAILFILTNTLKYAIRTTTSGSIVYNWKQTYVGIYSFIAVATFWGIVGIFLMMLILIVQFIRRNVPY